MKFKFGQKLIDLIRGKKKEKPCNINKFLNTYSEHSKNISGPWVENNTSFYELFKNHSGYSSTKWESYFHVYSKVLKPYIEKNVPLNLLEIGVQNGGSLQMWSKFLPKGSKIIGIDIDPNCAKLKYDENISILIGNATDEQFLNANLKDKKFDIIIDDGSHICSDVTNAFTFLFDRLNFGGLYIVEDCCTSYWPSHKGAFRLSTSTIEYFKNIIDAINFQHIKIFPENFGDNEIEKLYQLNKQIASIQFYDAIIVIEKYIKLKERFFNNYFTDGEDPVVDKYDCLKIGGIAIDTNYKFEKFFKG